MIVNPVISKAEKINAAMTLRDEVAWLPDLHPGQRPKERRNWWYAEMMNALESVTEQNIWHIRGGGIGNSCKKRFIRQNMIFTNIWLFDLVWSANPWLEMEKDHGPLGINFSRRIANGTTGRQTKNRFTYGTMPCAQDVPFHQRLRFHESQSELSER
jgi:hypothetical protein